MAEHYHAPASKPLVSHLDNTKLAMWLFLGGEVIFFTTLILTLILFRIVHAAEFAAFKEHLSIPLIGLNTFILISSSYLVVRGLEALQGNRLQTFTRYLIGVIVLGAAFLAGQAYEWISLFREGVGVKDVFGTPFFSITGIHGTHVFVGLLWAAILLISRNKSVYNALHQSPVEMFGLYWHFVDIVWIVLFTVIYLI